MEELSLRHEGGWEMLPLNTRSVTPTSAVREDEERSESSAPPEQSDSVLSLGLINTAGILGDSIDKEMEKNDHHSIIKGLRFY